MDVCSPTLYFSTDGVCTHTFDRLVGPVVKASASKAEDPGFESRLRRDCSGSNHTSDLKIDTPVATLHSARHYRVRAGTVCGSTYTCLSRSAPEIHKYVAGTLSNQPTTNTTHKFCLGVA